MWWWTDADTSKRSYLPADMTSRDSTFSKTAVRTQFMPYTISICNEPPIHDLSASIHGTGNGVWCNMYAEHITDAAMSASCTKVFCALRFRYSLRMWHEVKAAVPTNLCSTPPRESFHHGRTPDRQRSLYQKHNLHHTKTWVLRLLKQQTCKQF